MQFNTSRGFFGTRLGTYYYCLLFIILLRKTPWIDHETPIIVCDTTACLRNRGLLAEGVFDDPFDVATVAELKQRYDIEFATLEDKLSKQTSILNERHLVPLADVAFLLKTFLVELEEPVGHFCLLFFSMVV